VYDKVERAVCVISSYFCFPYLIFRLKSAFLSLMGQESAASIPLIRIVTVRRMRGKLYGKDMRTIGVI